MKVKVYIDDHCNVYSEKTLEGVIQERLNYVKEREIDEYYKYWVADLAQEENSPTFCGLLKPMYSNLFSTWLIDTVREEVINEMLIREVEI